MNKDHPVFDHEPDGEARRDINIGGGDIRAGAVVRSDSAHTRNSDINIYYSTGASTAPYSYKEDDLLAFYNERFVGREDVFADLNRWIAENDRGYLLFEDGPGTGKSALVAQIVKRHGDGRFFPQARLSYVFIRRDNRQEFAKHAFSSLNQQWLDHISPGGGVPADIGQLRRQARGLRKAMGAHATEEHPWLILVDGLDEAQDSGEWPADHPDPAHLLDTRFTAEPEPA